MCKVGKVGASKKLNWLTDVDLLLVGEVYRYSERKSVITCLGHWKLSPARILQNPKLPDLKMDNSLSQQTSDAKPK